MSTTIWNNGIYKLTVFWGGIRRGKMIQITLEEGKDHLQLTSAEAHELGKQLIEWVSE